MTIEQRLRKLCAEIRRRPTAIADIVPLLQEAADALAQKPPVAWFKHGPYADDEPMVCVFEDPHDDVCYSPLVYGGEH